MSKVEQNKDTKYEIISKLDKYFKSAIEHPTTKDWVLHAVRDFEFYEGKQWTNDELSELRKRGQPDIIENEIFYKINALKGKYKKQKTKIIFKGRNLAQDEPVANTLSDLTLHVLQRNQYEFEEDKLFEDGIVSGVGWLELSIEFDEMFTPEIKIKALDNLDIYPDPYSKKYDLSDAQYICIAKWVNVDEAKSLYPDKELEINSYFTSVSTYGNLSSIDKLRNDYYVDSKNQRLRLVEIRYKEKIKKKFLLVTGLNQNTAQELEQPQTPNNINNDISELINIIDITDKSESYIRRLQKQYPYSKIHEKTIDNIKVVVFCGEVLLSEPKNLPHDYKSFFLIPYYVYRKKNGEPYGVVRMLIDPQTEINKRRSKALHLLMTNQVITEENNIRDEDDFRIEMAKPDGILKVRNKEKVEIIKNIDLAQTQMNLLAESKSAIDRIAGVPTEPVPSEEIRSGIGLARKQAAIDMPITPIFENLRRTRLLLGKHIYELIKQYYTEEKVYYILDDTQRAKQFAWTQQHIQNLKESIYDVIIEEMPDISTVQEEQFQTITQLIQSFNLPPQLAMSIFPLIIQLSSIRNKNEILAKFDQMMQPSPILPKMSLNINWDSLYPHEKAAFAEMFGRTDLAQMEIQIQSDPSFVTKAKEGLRKTQIKGQTDIQKAILQKQQITPEMLDLERLKHLQDIKQKQEAHELKMRQKQQEFQQNLQNKQMNDQQAIWEAIQNSKMFQGGGDENA